MPRFFKHVDSIFLAFRYGSEPTPKWFEVDKCLGVSVGDYVVKTGSTQAVYSEKDFLENFKEYFPDREDFFSMNQYN